MKYLIKKYIQTIMFIPNINLTYTLEFMPKGSSITFQNLKMKFSVPFLLTFNSNTQKLMPRLSLFFSPTFITSKLQIQINFKKKIAELNTTRQGSFARSGTHINQKLLNQLNLSLLSLENLYLLLEKNQKYRIKPASELGKIH